jgi:putative membrane protein
MERRYLMVGLAGAAPLLFRRGAAFGQNSPSNLQSPPQNPLDPSTYATETLQVGTLAKTTSEIALQNSQSRRVQLFATLEIAEQTAVAQSLTSNFDPPPVPLTPEQQQIVQSLQSLSEPDFDAAYLQVQTQGHRQLLMIQTDFVASNPDPASNFVHIALIATTSIKTHLAILRGLLPIAPDNNQEATARDG